MNTRTRYCITCLPALLALAGCATEPTRTESNFGDSVRQMITAQTYNPETLASPPEGAVEATDGRMLEGVLEAYRGTFSDPGSVGDAITINVGDGQ